MAAGLRSLMTSRSGASTAILVLVVVLASSCGALPRSHAAAAGAQPAGNPEIFGWEGLGGRLLMSNLLTTHTDGSRALDTSTWSFTGSEWAPVSGALAIPSFNAVNSALVYDSARHRDVLAAGSLSAGNGLTPQGTWEFDGQAWNAVSTPHQLPFFGQAASAAYSPELQATVLIDTCTGGMNGAGTPTFLFDGTDWRSVSSARWPGCPAVLAYSPHRQSIVALSLLDYQTWRFDGAGWSPIATGDGPTPAVSTGMSRQAPAVALDPNNDTWVVFGGFDGDTSFSDTWTGSAAGWVKQPFMLSPSSRSGWPGRPWMAWDSNLGGLVLFGGQAGANGPALGDTWSWNGHAWAQLAGPTYSEPAPAPVASAPVASAPRLSSPMPTTSAASAAR